MTKRPNHDDLDAPIEPAAEPGEAEGVAISTAVAKQSIGRHRTEDDDGFKLSEYERAFCDAYLTNGHKLRAAAIAAGYAEASADVLAGRLIRRPEVMRFIVSHSRNGLKMLLPDAVKQLGKNIKSKSGYVSNEAIKALFAATDINASSGGGSSGTQVIINLHPKDEQKIVDVTGVPIDQ